MANLSRINHRLIIATHYPDAEIYFGEGCGLNETANGAFQKIMLGKNVRCGANILITDTDWHLDDTKVQEPKEKIIKDNLWLGYGVAVMKGVCISKAQFLAVQVLSPRIFQRM